jgi:FMN phosphatase YigB (HAD superfamily)
VLADLGLPPQKALFVDDNPRALGWAAQAGARTMLVGRRDDAAFQQIGSLAELQSAMAGFTAPASGSH